VHEELRTCASGAFPRTLPAGGRSIRLTPGSLLVMPRGYWHETTAEHDSLSLNFTFDQPTWADVIRPGDTAGLVADCRWRELARGAGSPYSSAARRARERLLVLTRELPSGASGVDVDAALARLTPVETVDSDIFAPPMPSQHT
jgi:hypothetical protein